MAPLGLRSFQDPLARFTADMSISMPSTSMPAFLSAKRRQQGVSLPSFDSPQTRPVVGLLVTRGLSQPHTLYNDGLRMNTCNSTVGIDKRHERFQGS